MTPAAARAATRLSVRTLLAAAGLALAGCATTAPPNNNLGAALAGRLSIRVDAHNGEAARSASASFELRGDAQRGELTLDTPLGTMLARARWSPEGAEAVTPDGSTRHADLDALSQDLLHEQLPLSALVDWLRGRPWVGAPSSALSSGGFEQLGWSVDLSRQSEGWVVATRAAPPAITVRAKVTGLQ